MARSIRIQSAGAFYHIMARGNRREEIFHDDDDRRFFLRTLSQACERTSWRVHAWVLMSNHYHLFIQTPEPNLVAGNVSQQLRRLDMKAAIKKVPEELKRLLAEAHAGNSRMPTFCQPVAA